MTDSIAWDQVARFYDLYAQATFDLPFFLQDIHVGGTPPMMNKSRIAQGALTERSAPLCAASQSPRLIGVCAGTTHCCARETVVLASST